MRNWFTTPPLLFVMAETLMPALWIVFHNCYLYLCISSLLLTMADFGVLIFGVCFIFACLILELLLINQNKTTSKITQFTVFQLILNCGPRGSNSFFTRLLVLRINYNNIATNGSSEDFFLFYCSSNKNNRTHCSDPKYWDLPL